MSSEELQGNDYLRIDKLTIDYIYSYLWRLGIKGQLFGASGDKRWGYRLSAMASRLIFFGCARQGKSNIISAL